MSRTKQRGRRGPRQAEHRGGQGALLSWFRHLSRPAWRSRGRGIRGGGVLRPERIYILPTRAGLAYFFIQLVTLLGALNYQNNLGLLFTFTMICIGLISMYHCWFNLLGLEVSARDAAAVFVAQSAHFAVRVSETRGRARGEIRVRGDDARKPLAALDVETFDVVAPAPRRGTLALDLLRVETRYPLGLFRAWCDTSVGATCLVYPRPAARAPEPRPVAALDRDASGDMGIGADDFVGLRPYHAGDSPRRVNWKALARERGLIVSQFGGDRSARIWLDWDQFNGHEAEVRLGLLCRQVLNAAEQNLSYGMHLPGRSIAMGRGTNHARRCLEALARFDE